MTKADKAAALHREKNYNCCQAVVCAFAEELGVDPQILFKTAEGFGSGMGGMKGDCGALAGAVMVNGLKNSNGQLDRATSKAATQKISREIFDQFAARTGSPVCRELKGVDTGKVLCSCENCIRIAAEIAEETLNL